MNGTLSNYRTWIILIGLVYLSGCASLSGDKAAGRTSVKLECDKDTGACVASYDSSKELELYFEYSKSNLGSIKAKLDVKAVPDKALEAAVSNNSRMMDTLDNLSKAVVAGAKKSVAPTP